MADREQELGEPRPQESRLKQLLKGEWPLEVKPEQLESYLASNRRSASSLLAAFRLTGDRALLKEAAERFPSDPRVAYESWFRTEDNSERQRWLETWAKAEPNNALASYLAAANLFKSGNTEAAIQNIEAAAAKEKFSYFGRETILDCEEAYKAAGYSEAEAKMASTFGLLLPHLAPLKQMSQSLADLGAAYRQGGDEASAQAVAGIGLQMADRISGDKSCLIEELVSIAVRANLLKALDPSAPSGLSGKTVLDLTNEGLAQRDSLKASGKRAAAVIESLSDAEMAAYCDRCKLLGETQANRWLFERFDGPQSANGP